MSTVTCFLFCCLCACVCVCAAPEFNKWFLKQHAPLPSSAAFSFSPSFKYCRLCSDPALNCHPTLMQPPGWTNNRIKGGKRLPGFQPSPRAIMKTPFWFPGSTFHLPFKQILKECSNFQKTSKRLGSAVSRLFKDSSKIRQRFVKDSSKPKRPNKT